MRLGLVLVGAPLLLSGLVAGAPPPELSVTLRLAPMGGRPSPPRAAMPPLGLVGFEPGTSTTSPAPPPELPVPAPRAPRLKGGRAAGPANDPMLPAVVARSPPAVAPSPPAESPSVGMSGEDGEVGRPTAPVVPPTVETSDGEVGETGGLGE